MRALLKTQSVERLLEERLVDDSLALQTRRKLQQIKTQRPTGQLCDVSSRNSHALLLGIVPKNAQKKQVTSRKEDGRLAREARTFSFGALTISLQ
jgi:hypothetical protein